MDLFCRATQDFYNSFYNEEEHVSQLFNASDEDNDQFTQRNVAVESVERADKGIYKLAELEK